MEPVKTGVDVGSVGSSIIALMNVMNPILEGIVLLLTIMWFVYRFATRKTVPQRKDE